MYPSVSKAVPLSRLVLPSWSDAALVAPKHSHSITDIYSTSMPFADDLRTCPNTHDLKGTGFSPSVEGYKARRLPAAEGMRSRAMKSFRG